MKLSLVVLVLALPHTVAAVEEATDDESFFHHCSGGRADMVKAALDKNPDWINRRTQNGETCLHVAGIPGSVDVTTLLLERGADPNIRTTYEQGLRMHPLSWNVYGGHVETAKILLENGADVNMDFDSMVDGSPTTSTGVVLELVKNESGDDRFTKMEKLLRAHGGKTIEELRPPEKEL